MTNIEKIELEILLRIKNSKENELKASQLAKELNLDFNSLSSIIEKLKSEGLIEYQKINHEGYSPTAKAKGLNKLVEVELLEKLFELKKIELEKLTQEEKIGLSFALKNGWIKLENKIVTITKKGEEDFLNKNYIQLPQDNNYEKLNSKEIEFLLKRGLIEKKIYTKDYIIRITQKTRSLNLEEMEKEQIKEIDREMLLSKSWKGKRFSRYNISAFVEENIPAKRHPIEILKRKIKLIFLKMGFKEMQGDLIETSFWNFDALFQPQDHPARDLADTFYLDQKADLENTELLKKIQNVHQKNWGGKWLKEMASKMLLRTHTTALSARTLYNKKDKLPEKYFAIGKVFRNEATDYKHLAEFYQIEGIVIWQKANFCHLLGVLEQFYKQLGFDKIRFRPSYFPYTEPSLEIEVYYEPKKQWLELGGAGIFRPEVSIPLANVYPVLAWGLSLERPLMLNNEIDDIRKIYTNELDWLRSFKYQK